MTQSDHHTSPPRPWIAYGGLVVGAAYLLWRASTGQGVPALLFWPLLIVEAFTWFRVAMRAALTWSISPSTLQASNQLHQTAIVVAAFTESVDSVRATLIGCREVRYPHTTVLMDDADRDDLALLADEMGVTYLRRTDKVGGRTGALNHVLSTVSSDLLLLLDGGQVPLPDALHRTVGYFDDPTMAVVQTPIEYQNRDSVIHAERNRHDRSFNNEVLSPGRDHWDAAVWEGPAALIRRDAFLDIGGIPRSGSTGELQATIELQSRGWTTRFHTDVIAYGLAAHDLRSLLQERARWARGHLAVLFTRRNPLWKRRLQPAQRLSHIELLSNDLAALFHMVGLAVLVASLLTGRLPFNASPLVVGAALIVATLAGSASRVSLGRGRVAVGETALQSALSFQINLTALAATILRYDRRFAPLSGPRTDSGGLDVLRQLSVLATTTLVLEVALALRLLDSLVGAPLPGEMTGLPLAVVAGASTVVLWFLLRVLGVFVGRRQLRTDHRQNVDLSGVADGTTVVVRDLGLGGFSIVTDQPATVGDRFDIGLQVLRVDGTPADVWTRAEVRSSVSAADGRGYRLGCQFTDLDPGSRDLLLEFLVVTRPFAELRAMRQSTPSGPSTASA